MIDNDSAPCTELRVAQTRGTQVRMAAHVVKLGALMDKYRMQYAELVSRQAGEIEDCYLDFDALNTANEQKIVDQRKELEDVAHFDELEMKSASRYPPRPPTLRGEVEFQGAVGVLGGAV